ncbi:MAG: ribonuclease III, partial [Bacteroidota bacterium]
MGFLQNIFNSRRQSDDGIFFLKLEKLLGFKIKTKSLYIKAFTHRSMNIKDEQGNAINYERLEFVGDAMLGAVIAAYLYDEVP